MLDDFVWSQRYLVLLHLHRGATVVGYMRHKHSERVGKVGPTLGDLPADMLPTHVQILRESCPVSKLLQYKQAKEKKVHFKRTHWREEWDLIVQ